MDDAVLEFSGFDLWLPAIENENHEVGMAFKKFSYKLAQALDRPGLFRFGFIMDGQDALARCDYFEEFADSPAYVCR